MIRMLPVFRSAKNTRPSEAKARAIGHERPVWTGPSSTAGLFGFPPPPGRLTKYQANATVARIARAAMTTTVEDRKSTRLNSSHVRISYAVFCLKKKNRSRGDRPVQLGGDSSRYLTCDAVVSD